MTVQDKTTLKSYFQRGLRPTQAQYGNLIDSCVNVSGDTMTGELLLFGNPTNVLGAVPKQYVDAIVSGVSAPYPDTTAIVKGSVDPTKLARFEVDGNTAGVTRVVTIPNSDGTIAYLASPGFTGTPTAPTAIPGTNTTQLATTAFVQANSSQGGLTLISKTSFSGAASAVITTGIDSTYDNYLIIGRRVFPATDGVYLMLRYSINGGSSYLSTGYVAQTYQNKGTSFNSGKTTDGIYIVPNAAGYFLDNSSDDGANFKFDLYNPASNGATVVRGDGSYFESGGSDQPTTDFGGTWRGGTNPINALQFIMSSGNISGDFYLYGYKKS